MKLFGVFQDKIYKLELYYAKNSIHGVKTLQNDRNESMLGMLVSKFDAHTRSMLEKCAQGFTKPVFNRVVSKWVSSNAYPK